MVSNASDPVSEKEKRTRYSVVLITTAVALFVPVLIVMPLSEYAGYVSILAMTWWWHSFGPTSPIFSPFALLMILSSLPLMFFRLVFIYMINRYYLGKTTRQKVTITGIIAEIQPVGIFYFPYIISYILYPGSMMFYQIAVPIPALIIVGYILLRLRPPKLHKSWVEESDTGGWWDEEDAPPSQTKGSEQEKNAEVSSKQERSDTESDSDWLKDSW